MINDVDVVFHDILLQKAMRQDGDSYTGYKLRDSSAHAQLVGLYATQAESVRSDLERQSRASEEVVAISTSHELRGGSALIEVNKQKSVNQVLIPRLNGEY
jgi:HPt (histidine-containing phosphotransfer) domain-containing protein